jgi:hypothetical protein
VVITSAERSLDEQRRHREIRYVAMMLVRAGCVVVAAVLVGVRAPLLWLWLPLCGVGMVLIPWLAVLLANDRPPMSRAERARRRAGPTGPAALTDTASATREARTIDAQLPADEPERVVEPER